MVSDRHGAGAPELAARKHVKNWAAIRRSLNPFRMERRFQIISSKPGVQSQIFFWHRRRARISAVKRTKTYAKVEVIDTWNDEQLYIFFG